MNHSDALTDQQKADCLLTVGDWDAHCKNVLTNIQQEAAKIRFNQALAIAGKIASGNDQTAVIQAMISALPQESLDIMSAACTAQVAKIQLPGPARLDLNASGDSDIPG